MLTKIHLVLMKDRNYKKKKLKNKNKNKQTKLYQIIQENQIQHFLKISLFDHTENQYTLCALSNHWTNI